MPKILMPENGNPESPFHTTAPRATELLLGESHSQVGRNASVPHGLPVVQRNLAVVPRLVAHLQPYGHRNQN